MRKWLRGLFGEPELDQTMTLMLDESFRLIREIGDLSEELEALYREKAELKATLERRRGGLTKSRPS